MQILLSPAKSLNWESALPQLEYTQAEFLAEAEQLIKVLKKKKEQEISVLMDISPSLSQLNRQRYQDWTLQHEIPMARPAIYAFDGDVYTGLDAYTLSDSAVKYAQENLKILSGLYGILRPLDLIHPYRLEMGTSLAVKKHPNLYSFWEKKMGQYLKSLQPNMIINLASEEYFRVIPKSFKTATIIQPSFYDMKNGQYKIISFFAKKARGTMARYICENQITAPEDIKTFQEDGYSYSEHLSKENKWVFLRG